MQNPFITLLRILMKQKKLSQPKLANISGIPRETIRSWFKRNSLPRDWESVIQIAAALQVDHAITVQLLNVTGHPALSTLQHLAISEIDNARLTADEFRVHRYRMLKEAIDQWLRIENDSLQQGAESRKSDGGTARSAAQLVQGELPARQNTFFGRESEIAQLEKWLIGKEGQLAAIVGSGGIGKTTLAAQVVDIVAQPPLNQSGTTSAYHFEQIIWRSLINSPPLETILKMWLQSISPKGQTSYSGSIYSESIDQQIDFLFEYFQENSCLLILDNFESILAAGERVGSYRTGYEAYSRLLQRFGSTQHNSCLLITSRETPLEITRLARTFGGVKILPIGGLSHRSGADLIRNSGLAGSADIKAGRIASLIERYSGNPLGLKLVAETVNDLYAGNIESFLADETVVFDDIYEVIEQQYDRLSDLEQAILIWLTIEREPVTAQTLQENLLKKRSRRKLREALLSLLRRSIIEIHVDDAQTQNPPVRDQNDGRHFSLQNVIMEYVMEKIVQTAAAEFINGPLDFVLQYALIKSQSRSYVIEAQRRLLLKPVAQQIINGRGQANLMSWANEKLGQLRAAIGNAPSYAGGTLLNLLIDLQNSGYPIELSKLDFSGLALWHAILQDQKLQNVNFARCDLSHAKFTDTFSSIWSLSYTPDGQFLIAGTTNGMTRIWQSHELQIVADLHGHSGIVRSVAISADGRTLVTGSEDGTARIWDISGLNAQEKGVLDVSTIFCCQILDHHSFPIAKVAIAPVTTAPVATAPVATAPDNQLLATASYDGIIRLWTTESAGVFELSQQLQGHEGRVRGLSFHPQQKLLASCGDDGTVRLWDLRTAQCIETKLAHDAYVYAVDISADGLLLASCGADKMVHVWEIGDASRIDNSSKNNSNDRLSKDEPLTMFNNQQTLVGHTLAVHNVVFNPDGTRLASCAEDGLLLLWDLSSGVIWKSIRGHEGWIRGVGFAPQGNVIASAGIDATLRLWDTESGENINNLHGFSISITSASLSPDEKQLVTGDYVVRLWDLADTQYPKILAGHDSFIWQVHYSHTGRWIASASNDASIRLWDPITSKSVYKLQTEKAASSMAFSQDDQILASGEYRGRVKLWTVNTGQLLHTFTDAIDIIWGIDFSSDGSFIAAACEDGKIYIWTLPNHELTSVIHAHSPVRSIAISPTQPLLAGGVRDKTIKLWNTESGEQIALLSAHTDLVSGLRFSADGETLISSSFDGSICLWNVDSQQLISQLPVHDGAIRSIHFAPKSTSLVSGSNDGTIKIYEIGHIIDKAEENHPALRNLQQLRVPGPYAGMNIRDVSGITTTQRNSLMALGAVGDDAQRATQLNLDG